MFARIVSVARAPASRSMATAAKPSDPIQQLFLAHLEKAKKVVYASGAVRLYCLNFNAGAPLDRSLEP